MNVPKFQELETNDTTTAKYQSYTDREAVCANMCFYDYAAGVKVFKPNSYIPRNDIQILNSKQIIPIVD